MKTLNRTRRLWIPGIASTPSTLYDGSFAGCHFYTIHDYWNVSS